MDNVIYKELDNKIVGGYGIEGKEKRKLLKKWEIQLLTDSGQDLCKVKINAVLTIDKEDTYNIEYPSHGINIDYENTLNDDYSIFLVKQNGGMFTKNNLVEIYINVYKKSSYASNKKMIAVGAIVIDNKGELGYEHT